MAATLGVRCVLVFMCSAHAFLSPVKHYEQRTIRMGRTVEKRYSAIDDTKTESSSSPTLIDERVPCSIVSGYFYCGKTTFVRNALQNKENLHLGVVVAEMVD